MSIRPFSACNCDKVVAARSFHQSAPYKRASGSERSIVARTPPPSRSALFGTTATDWALNGLGAHPSAMVRMRSEPKTQAYVARQTSQGRRRRKSSAN